MPERGSLRALFGEGAQDCGLPEKGGSPYLFQLSGQEATGRPSRHERLVSRMAQGGVHVYQGGKL